MPSLAFKNSLICVWFRLSAFRILICIPQRLAYPVPPIFRIILCWNQVSFQDHLVLDNSVSGGPLSGGLYLVFPCSESVLRLLPQGFCILGAPAPSSLTGCTPAETAA